MSEPKLTKNNIKARVAMLGLRSVDIIDMIRDAGITVGQDEFSKAIHGRLLTPKAELICETANKILDKIEKEMGVRR